MVQSLHQQAKLALELYAAPEWREEGLARWTEATLRHLRAAAPGSDHQLAWARAFAAAARTDEQLDVLASLLDGTGSIDGLAVDTELRWALLEPAGGHRPGRRRGDRGGADPGLHRRR